MNFLKPKKGQKGSEALAAASQNAQLPNLRIDRELYSELPNLPEAPETSGLPEIELPEPLKGLEGFDMPGTGEIGEVAEGEGELWEKKAEGEGGSEETPAAEPLLPNWPQLGKSFEKHGGREKLPELLGMPDTRLQEEPEAKTGLPAIPSEVPELRQFEPRQKGEFGEGLRSYGGDHYLSSADFRMVDESFNSIIRTQKKHHKLTEMKKEENQHYDQINALFEDLQRKLMLIDKTLFG